MNSFDKSTAGGQLTTELNSIRREILNALELSLGHTEQFVICRKNILRILGRNGLEKKINGILSAIIGGANESRG